jgi:hypothetical protein
MTIPALWRIAAIGVLLVCGCSPGSSQIELEYGEVVEIRLDKGNAPSLIGFYIGGFLPKGGSLNSLVVQDGSKWWLKKPHSEAVDLGLVDLYNTAGVDRILSWEEFEPVVRSTYYKARSAPSNVQGLKSAFGDWDQPEWFGYESKGQMTQFRRRLLVRREALMSSLERLNSVSDPILYDEGTIIIGEHLEGQEVVETTAMIKRADKYWDYFAYGSDGNLTGSIQKSPDPILVPTQCVGCHYGDKSFEPEKSFPNNARPGPSGERAVFVPDDWKNAGITRQLSEHAKRSDHVLGLYGTLFLADMVARAGKGETSDRESKLIQKLGIE